MYVMYGVLIRAWKDKQPCNPNLHSVSHYGQKVAYLRQIDSRLMIIFRMPKRFKPIGKSMGEIGQVCARASRSFLLHLTGRFDARSQRGEVIWRKAFRSLQFYSSRAKQQAPIRSAARCRSLSSTHQRSSTPQLQSSCRPSLSHLFLSDLSGTLAECFAPSIAAFATSSNRMLFISADFSSDCAFIKGCSVILRFVDFPGTLGACSPRWAQHLVASSRVPFQPRAISFCQRNLNVWTRNQTFLPAPGFSTCWALSSSALHRPSKPSR
jgi:hypothetical protein